jgi:hypothetical protein
VPVPAEPVVLVEVVLVLVVAVLVTAAVGAEVGTVNVGAPAVLVVPEPPPPHAAKPSATVIAAPATAGLSVLARYDISLTVACQEPSGAMRRPQWGQSFKSFGAS